MSPDESRLFLNRIESLSTGNGVSLNLVLKRSLRSEAYLCRLFATDNTDHRLNNPYVGLVDVFASPATVRIARARVIESAVEFSARYVMPLSDHVRRPEGSATMVPDIDTFERNWSLFTENSLVHLLDWRGVVAAGGSVLACLTPLPDSTVHSRGSMRRQYHVVDYPKSDIDLFLWGMTPDEVCELSLFFFFHALDR
jgi:hypothetical protein